MSFANLIIHYTVTPTHTGTKQKTTVVSHTHPNLNFFILFSFYDILIRLTLTGANKLFVFISLWQLGGTASPPPSHLWT